MNIQIIKSSIKKLVINNITKLISVFFHKKKTVFFCVPNHGCKNNLVDIINYTADNTLTYLNYMLRHYNGDRLTIYLAVFDKNRILTYEKYIDSFQNDKLHFIFWAYIDDKKYRHIIFFMKSYYILTSDITMRFSYKIKKQIYISLNYFPTGFKSDFVWLLKYLTYPMEYVISTSNVANWYNASIFDIPVKNFRTLGFPRNDNIINPRFSRNDLITMLNLPYKINKIITYTPTHRDYEQKVIEKRHILGYQGNDKKLQEILEKNEAIIIIRLHPKQNKECIRALDSRRILNDVPNYQYNLYDILAHTDVLLTDYTSTYFDFLLKDKPIIFNFYDKEVYKTIRGFSFDPIETICAGPIVKNKDELFLALEQALSGKDDYKSKRFFVNTLFNKYIDSNSSKRVFDFFQTLLVNEHN
jgi:CDP-glycerol glycerophosphotransferase (TagB/SpsB family)